MAIISCPECGKQVSDTAPACPSCGAPVSQLTARHAAHVPAQAKPKSSTRPWAWVMFGVLGTLGLVFFVFTKGNPQQERAEQQKTPMPVALTYRKAVVGPGLVVGLKNNSERHLAVVLTVANPTTKQEKSFRVDVSPKQTTEIGHLEGWTFASGDMVKVVHSDYRAWQGKLP